MEAVINFISMFSIGLGAVALVIGAAGLVRLPDVYTRIHAAGVIDTGGVALIILGLSLHSGVNLVTVKLVFIGVFLFFTSPVSGHIIAQVAKSQKIEVFGTDETSPEHSDKAED